MAKIGARLSCHSASLRKLPDLLGFMLLCFKVHKIVELLVIPRPLESLHHIVVSVHRMIAYIIARCQLTVEERWRSDLDLKGCLRKWVFDSSDVSLVGDSSITVLTSNPKAYFPVVPMYLLQFTAFLYEPTYRCH